MMYNFARTLALIGLVGVSATNHTNTTSSGSTQPPSSGGCTEWGILQGTSLSRRQLTSNNTGNANCPDDVPRCVYVNLHFASGAFKSSYNSTTGCPSQYSAADAGIIKDGVSKMLCGTDTDCSGAVKTNTAVKVHCKGTSGTLTEISSARRLSTKDVELKIFVAMNVGKAVADTTAFTAEKFATAAGAVAKTEADEKKATLGAAALTALKAAAPSTLPTETLFSNVATVSAPTMTGGDIMFEKPDCSAGGTPMKDYVTVCDSMSAQKDKKKCTLFKAASQADSSTPSNAVSLMLSAVVLAVAALI